MWQNFVLRILVKVKTKNKCKYNSNKKTIKQQYNIYGFDCQRWFFQQVRWWLVRPILDKHVLSSEYNEMYLSNLWQHDPSSPFFSPQGVCSMIFFKKRGSWWVFCLQIWSKFCKFMVVNIAGPKKVL